MPQPNKIDQRILLGEDYISIWIEAFIKERIAQNLAKGTIQFYKDKLIPFADYCDGQEVKYISQITPYFIRDYLILLSETHNDGGVHGYYRAIKAFLRWYWDEVEPDSRNPIDKVKAPKNPEEPLEGISRENFDKLLETCENTFYGIRDRTILLVLLDTGVRATELCQINIQDLDFADSSILIRQGKGRKPRFVFIGKTTRRQVRKWLRLRNGNDGALFLNRYGERITYDGLREIMRRLSEKAGIPAPSLHDFRRAFCLECMRKDMDLLTISRLMGHTSLQMLSRYAKQTAMDLSNSYKSVVDD